MHYWLPNFFSFLQLVEIEMDIDYSGGFQLSIDADLVQWIHYTNRHLYILVYSNTHTR